MTLHQALNAGLPRMAQRELDEARRVIGAHKLDLRRARPLWAIDADLKPLNRRIDDINIEDMGRQALRRGPNQ